MKNIICLIILLLFTMCMYTHKNHTYALLYYNDLPITIYDSSGNIIGKIINNPDNDKFILLDLYSICGDKAHVTAKYAFNDTFKISGYINAINLGIRTINSDTIFLYETPNKGAIKIDTIINANWTNMYRILEIKNQWLYIERDDRNKRTKGWLAPQDQCFDPVTISC